ncbi:MAG: hypothetical protein ACREBE_26385 [bacterium]
MTDVASVLRATARVLVVHGTVDDVRAFVDARAAVTRGFLGTEVLGMKPYKNDASLLTMEVGDYRAVWCRPLNSAIAGTYLDTVGELVQPYLPKFGHHW